MNLSDLTPFRGWVIEGEVSGAAAQKARWLGNFFVAQPSRSPSPTRDPTSRARESRRARQILPGNRLAIITLACGPVRRRAHPVEETRILPRHPPRDGPISDDIPGTPPHGPRSQDRLATTTRQPSRRYHARVRPRQATGPPRGRNPGSCPATLLGTGRSRMTYSVPPRVLLPRQLGPTRWKERTPRPPASRPGPASPH